jgi:hypothetical protein
MIRETPGDRARQQVIADRIAAAHGLTMYPTPTVWPYDYASENPITRSTALWEMKWHTRPWPLFDISSAKVSDLLALGREHRCPVCLGAGYADGSVAWVRLDAGNGYVRDLGGRLDRGRCELESVWRIPVGAFTAVP